MNPESLDLLEARGVLDPLDREFADFIHGLDGGDGAVALAAALVSRALGQGDVCLDLPQWAGQNLSPGYDPPLLRAPGREAWLEALGASPVVGQPGDFQPLILDAGERLYLYRYWSYEAGLAQALMQRAGDPPAMDAARLQAGLQRLFPSQGDGPDGQRLAAAVAASNRLAVISGGPGTGKTTTLARVLALLLGEAPTLRIRLAAPTGKAAARLQEAVLRSKQALRGQVPQTVLEAIPDEASTLHRLLGVSGDGVSFRHGPARPLNLDLLAIDEASMVDLALMAKTVAALPADARLILLGDRDQLSSVEAGAVLGELCQDAVGFSPAGAAGLQALTGEAVPVARATGPLMDQVTLLVRSYRFQATGGIGQLAALINQGDRQGLRTLAQTPMADVHWLSIPAAGAMEALLETALSGFSDYLAAVAAQADAETVFQRFAAFQLLCPQRVGDWGVENLNRLLEARIRQRLGMTGREWYPGRALMVTRNDYTLQLYNGDVGIVLADASRGGQLRACFPRPEGGVRRLALSRLPAVEPVFAMTVHKSQGSEFDQVLLVLPPGDGPGVQSLGRELLYTAVTRARERLVLWGSVEQLAQAAGRSVRRASGLRERLLEKP